MFSIKKITKAVLVLSILMGTSLNGSASASGTTAVDGVEQGKGAREPETRIVINTANRGLYLYSDGVKIRLYPIAVGSVNSPTPTGYYQVLEKTVNPTWKDPKTGKEIESGPECPIGYRWIRFYGNYGIHGTNNPSSIGQYISNGCVRMRNSDAEELFDMISIGTPVDITYNRVVVEKAPDDTIVYYIYPDSYNMQPLDVETVNKWLNGFGVSAFESDSSIEEKINTSDGNPTFIAKAYEILIDGKSLTGGKAVLKEGIVYLPAIPIAEAMRIRLDYKEGVLMGEYGRVPSMIFKNELFINADDVEDLYHLEGGFSGGKYRLSTIVEPAIPQVDTKNTIVGTQATSTNQTENQNTNQNQTQSSNQQMSQNQAQSPSQQTSQNQSKTSSQQVNQNQSSNQQENPQLNQNSKSPQSQRTTQTYQESEQRHPIIK